MKHTHSLKLLAAFMVAAAMLVAGCSKSDNNQKDTTSQQAATTTETTGSNTANETNNEANNDQASEAAASQPKASGTIKLAYVEWDSCTAATDVAKVVLEKAGYDVKAISVTGAMMYQGMATGDVDATVCAWLPTTHKDYYAKTKDRLTMVGTNMKSARLGLAVPDYVKIDSIAQLSKKDVAKRFDNRIVGIDPGAGIMRLTHKVIKHYDLPEKLVEGSDATMTAALKEAIRRHEPIAVTSWVPHWMWGAWDLKFLKDPDNVYGKPDNIDTLAHKGFKKAKPIAYNILKKFKMPGDARSAIMVANRKNNADPLQNARNWVKNHPKKVNAWLSND